MEHPDRFFLFRLAALFGCTVRELKKRVSSKELIEWMAFYNLDPWGGYRLDINSAQICTTMANIHRASDSKGFDLPDFMLYRQHFVDEPDMSAEQISAALDSILSF